MSPKYIIAFIWFDVLFFYLFCNLIYLSNFVYILIVSAASEDVTDGSDQADHIWAGYAGCFLQRRSTAFTRVGFLFIFFCSRVIISLYKLLGLSLAVVPVNSPKPLRAVTLTIGS